MIDYKVITPNLLVSSDTINNLSLTTCVLHHNVSEYLSLILVSWCDTMPQHDLCLHKNEAGVHYFTNPTVQYVPYNIWCKWCHHYVWHVTSSEKSVFWIFQCLKKENKWKIKIGNVGYSIFRHSVHCTQHPVMKLWRQLYIKWACAS